LAERLTFIPALDGIRGLALVLIAWVHWGTVYRWPRPTPWLEAGSVGVDVFFGLSGFLITALLLQEHQRTGRVSFRSFYSRRALRLLPVLAVFLTVHVIWAVGVGISLRTELLSVVAAAVYLFNYLFASNHVVANGMEHVWTLSVEEQFYLLWPMSLVFLVRRAWKPIRVVTLLVVLALVSAIWRASLVGHAGDYNWWYHATDARADSLLLGCALAVVRHRWGLPVRWAKPAGWIGTALIAITFVIHGSNFNGRYGHFIASAATALIVGAAATRTWSMGGVLSSKLMVAIGQRSYSGYLWHVLAATAVLRWHIWGIRGLLLALVITVVLTEITYRTLEEPLRSLRSRLHRQEISWSSLVPRAVPDYGGRLLEALRASTYRLAVAGVLVAAAVVRFAMVLGTRHRFALDGDAADFQRIATSLAHGHGFGVVPGAPGLSALRGPAYPTVLSLVYRVFGTGVTVGRLTTAVISVAAVAAIGAVALRLVGRRPALVVLGLAAVFPSMLVSSYTLSPMPMALLFVALALWAALAAPSWRHPVGGFALAGVFVGLAALTQQTMAVVGVTVMVVAWWSTKTSARRLRQVGAVVLAAIVVVAPWTIRNQRTYHQFVPIQASAGYTLAGQYNSATSKNPQSPLAWTTPAAAPEMAAQFAKDAPTNPAVLDSQLWSAARQFAIHHKKKTIKTVARNGERLLELDFGHYSQVVGAAGTVPHRLVNGSVIGFYVLVLLGLVTIVITRGRERRMVTWAVAITPVLIGLGGLVALGGMQMRAPIEMLLFLPAATVIVWAFDFCRAVVRTATRERAWFAPLRVPAPT
jgi:peptidoglycan/LPS O-acetylase OafA/YrhL